MNMQSPRERKEEVLLSRKKSGTKEKTRTRNETQKHNLDCVHVHRAGREGNNIREEPGSMQV